MGWSDILSGIIGFADDSNKSSGQDDYIALLQQQERNAYDQQLAEYNAKNEYLANRPARDTSGTKKTEAARLKALQAAQKKLNKNFKKQKRQLKAYSKAGRNVLPQHTAMYNQGAAGLGLLNQQLFSPENMAKLTKPKDFKSVGAGLAGFLPSHMTGRK